MATATPIDPNSAVHVSNMTFHYGKKPATLRDVNLNLPKGSRTLLVGDNGAGKSTL